MPAEKAVEIIDTRLSDFGIVRETDIIASTTDGASVMRKFGRLLKCENQSCHAHGLHLAVAKVIYEKPSVGSDESEDQENIEETENEEEEEADEEEEEENEGGNGIEDVSTDVPPFNDSLPHLNIIITKVRKIVKTFKKSPVKNDFLSKCCKDLALKDTKLVLDVKTRWNSVIQMIKSVLRISPAVNQALSEFSLPHLKISEAEVKVLEGIYDSLETVAAGATELGSNQMDLGKADQIMEFILAKLGQNKSPFGCTLRSHVV